LSPEQLLDESRIQGRENSLWVAITDPMYRKSTWICFMLSLFNMMTGVQALTYFIKQMFDEVEANSRDKKKILTTEY
jgi:hypothetical protein